MRLLERFPMSTVGPRDVLGAHDPAIEHDGLAPAQDLWRTTPAASCGTMELLRIRRLLHLIAMLDQPRWNDAARGDAAAAIAVAMDICDPEDGPSARFDLAMSALFACVVEGDLAARLVFRNLIRRADWLDDVEIEPVDLFRLMAEDVPGS